MWRCLNRIPTNSVWADQRVSLCRVIRKSSHQKRLYNIDPFTSNTQKKREPILTELVYGRKRIYTSLQTIGKIKPATTSKSRIAAPVTTSPMSWQWVQPQEDNQKQKKEWYQLRQNRNGTSAMNSIKQNMREMFLPVG
jgi:hypothetical protein